MARPPSVARRFIISYESKGRGVPPWRDPAIPGAWTCSRCGSALGLAPADFMFADNNKARHQMEDDEMGPEFVSAGPFCAMFRCQNCEEPHAACGDAGAENDGGGSGLYYVCDVSGFDPPPVFIPVLNEAPEAVRDVMAEADALWWTDASAAATRLRAAVEVLLDHFNIPRTMNVKGKPDPNQKGTPSPKSKGKREFRSLHRRIDLLAKKRAGAREHIDHLKAAKWVTNAPTHGGEFSDSDYFVARHVVCEALEGLFAPKETTTRLVRAINKHKKPPSQVRRKKDRV